MTTTANKTTSDATPEADQPASIHRVEETFSQLPYALAVKFQTPSKGSDSRRCKGLFVVRESDKWNIEQFDAMREQTYQTLLDIPEVRAINEIGLRPLDEEFIDVDLKDEGGGTTRVRVAVEEVRHGGAQARLFHLGGYWHLWARESAHHELEENEGEYVNPFTAILVDTIRKRHPRTLYAATASRLARNAGQSNALLEALPHNVDAVCIRDQLFDLTLEHRARSLMFLYFMFWAAAQERDAIVTRFATGKIGAWRRNEWPYGNAIVPFGHHLIDGQLVPDESMREVVKDMMVIASSDLSDKEKKRQLSKAGVTNMRLHPTRGTRDPIGSQTNSTTVINTLMAWAPIWVQGEYLYRLGGHFPKTDSLIGVPVVHRNEDDPGELQMLYKVPPPKDGWAETDIVAAFAEAAKARFAKSRHRPRPLAGSIQSQSSNPSLLKSILPAAYAAGSGTEDRTARLGSRGREHISPFSGRVWTDENHRFELCMFPRGYRVRRRPLTATDNFTGREVAYFTHEQFAKNLLPALTAALQDGVPVEFLPGHTAFATRDSQHVVDTFETTKRLMSDSLKDAQRRADQNMANSATQGISTELRATFIKRADDALGEAQRIQADLSDHELRKPHTATNPETFDVRTDVWLPAIAALDGTTRVPQAKYQALKTIITDLRLDNHNGIWTGSLIIRVNTSAGVGLLGPIRWRIGSGGDATQALTARHADARHVTKYESLVLREQLIGAAGVTEPAALVLLNSSFAELPHVVVNGATGTAFPDWVGEQWQEPTFVKWVTGIYTDPQFAWNVQYSDGSPARQECADFVMLHDTPVPGRAIVDAIPGLSSHIIRALGRPERRNGAIRVRQPLLNVVGPGRNFADRLFEPFTCPEGHRADIATRIPEIPTDLLCSCGRPAGISSVDLPPDLTFPDEYQLLRIPAAEATTLARDKSAQNAQTALGAAQVATLKMLATREPTTVRDLQNALVAAGLRTQTKSTAGVFTALQKLGRHGLVENDSGRPPRWSVTMKGRDHPVVDSWGSPSQGHLRATERALSHRTQ
jgi:hypothetical protein